MNDYESFELPCGFLEFIPSTHTYIFEGQMLPSITQILESTKFKNKYRGISKKVLDKAAGLGTDMHNCIEQFEKFGEETNLKELRNYKFLKKHYKWEVIECEKPVVLFKNDAPIACGRLDQIIKINEKIGINDLKRTSSFDKEYVAMQTNLYRIAYRQTYGIECEFLSGTHLREDKRRFIILPINENMAWKLVEDYEREVR